jgi:hypothetical protein
MLDKIKNVLEGSPTPNHIYRDYINVMEKFPHLFNHSTCKGLYDAAKRQLIKQRQDKSKIQFSIEDKDFLMSERRINDGPLSSKQNNFIKLTVEHWTTPVFQQAFKINQAFPFVTFNGFLSDGFIYEDESKEYVVSTVKECESKGWILNLIEDYEDYELQRAIFSLGVSYIHHNPQTFKKFLVKVKEPKLREHLEKTQTDLLSFLRFKATKPKLRYFQRLVQTKKALWSYAYNALLAELKTVKEYKGRKRSI